jgi:hypothetical protein
VLNQAGTAYIAQTTDSGTSTSVDATGGTLTLKEGTSKVTDGSATITVPSGATVTLNGTTNSLSALVAGDHVVVTSSSDGTSGFATDGAFSTRPGPSGRDGWGSPGPQHPQGQAGSQGPPSSSSSAG